MAVDETPGTILSEEPVGGCGCVSRTHMRWSWVQCTCVPSDRGSPYNQVPVADMSVLSGYP